MRYLAFFTMLITCLVAESSAAKVKFNYKKDPVHVSSKADMPDKYYWFGQGQALSTVSGGSIGAAVGVLIGAAASGAVAKPDKERLRDAIDSSRIDFGSKLAEAFSQRLEEDGANVGSETLAEYKFKFEFLKIGFTAKNSFTKKMVPMMHVRVRLLAPDGRVAWKFQTRGLFENMGVYKKEDVLTDAEILNDAFSSCTNEIARMMHYFLLKKYG